jgi:hypothetical protein
MSKMEATTQYFGKRFFINRSFIALQNFYARHLGAKSLVPSNQPMDLGRGGGGGDVVRGVCDCF